jgi:L-lysine exporter family protein LysE/ArgO
VRPFLLCIIAVMEFLSPVWKGLLTGLMFTLTFGTVFFSLIQTSIKRGLREGLYIASGVLMSDTWVVALSLIKLSIMIILFA